MTELDDDVCYRACSGRESRFDGQFYLGVITTGIYCLPSCPARTPQREHCRFFPTEAAAVASGFRACKRCRPDLMPALSGRPGLQDIATQAIQLIQDGLVDEVGVAGLASRLGVTQRHLSRVLLSEVGVGARQLNRTRRAQVARMLIATTTMSLTEVAFTAGFGSVRQFNEVIRAELGCAPSQLRRAEREARFDTIAEPRMQVRLTYRKPAWWTGLQAVLAAHAIPGVEIASPGYQERVVPTPEGSSLARVRWPSEDTGEVRVNLRLTQLSATLPVISAVRRWLDLDADPVLVDSCLSSDPRLAPQVAAHPGLRVPGVTDPAEFALFVVLGQQISLTAARTVQTRLVERFGVDAGLTGRWRRIDPRVLAEAGPVRLREQLRLTRAKATTLHVLATELANGLDLRPGMDPAQVRSRLLRLPGIGPWTSEFIAMRALADPDACPASDLVLARSLGVKPGLEVARLAERWRPWRAYATMHLWTKETYL